jgi:hypothetical protein
MFQINETRILISAKDGFDGRCNYLITIKTSCDSPTYTKDEISLLFGDGFGAEVLYYIYIQKLAITIYDFCWTINFNSILKLVIIVLIYSFFSQD